MNRLSKNKGFTLIELLVALGISGIVAAGLFMVYDSQQKAYMGQDQIVEMQQNLRAAHYIMIKEIRMAGYDPSGGSAGAGIVAIGDGSAGNPLIFTRVQTTDSVDNDGDGTTDETGELTTIEYELFTNGGITFIGRKQDGGALEAVSENVTALQFTYLDVNGAVTLAASLVRSIQVLITVAPDPLKTNYAGADRTINTTIKCRNLGV